MNDDLLFFKIYLQEGKDKQIVINKKCGIKITGGRSMKLPGSYQRYALLEYFFLHDILGTVLGKSTDMSVLG